MENRVQPAPPRAMTPRPTPVSEQAAVLPTRPMARLAERSETPSGPVRFMGWYFRLGGALSLTTLVLFGVAGALGWAPGRTLLSQPVGVVVAAITALGSIWAGRLLERGDRLGARLALPMLCVPIVARLLGQPVSGTTLLFSVGGLAVLAIYRRELR